MITAGAFILGLVCGFVGYAWLSAPERKRTRVNLSATQMERNYWRAKHHSDVGRLIASLHGSDNATYHLLAWESEMEEL